MLSTSCGMLKAMEQPRNPFTQSLAARLKTPAFQGFIAHWDALEHLVIRVFRGKAATPADEVEHATVRAWLLEHYAEWRDGLEPHWRQSKMAGKLATDDPFAILINVETAAAFVGQWPAMQALPAAREALNRLLLEHTA